MSSMNHNAGKPRLSLVVQDMRNAIEEMAKVREMGCKKYDRMNWAEDIGKLEGEYFLEDNLDSIYRHLSALNDGLFDEESTCLHMAHVAVRACFALEYAMSVEKA